MSFWFHDQNNRLVQAWPSRLVESRQVSSTMQEELNPPMPIWNDPNLGNVG